jgi:hypothetical protein
VRAEKSKQPLAAIVQLLDDYCGTPPRKWPWPYPGPPPWIWQIISELTAAANSYQEGALKSELQNIAGAVAEKGLAHQ